MTDTIRIAMWSGPRNISTAMMRSFGNRADTAVIDEPFYVPYLVETGIDHPMRDETIADGTADPDAVIENLLGPAPNDRPVFYQKQMTHHMLPHFRRDWIKHCRNAFLIRTPEKVLASYAKKRTEVTADDIGFTQQQALFEQEAQRLGSPPAVVDADDVLANPQGALTALCRALNIPFSEQMLRWPAGKRATDGVWAAVWYGAVEQSTGFARPEQEVENLPDALRKIADATRSHYEYLARFKLKPAWSHNPIKAS